MVTARSKPNVLRTQAFRIVLVYVLLFAFSVTALLGFTYWNTRRTLDAQADQIIEAEVTGLNEQYRNSGWQTLYRSVRSRSAPGASGQALYILADSAYSPLAGNLNVWPGAIISRTGDYIEFDYERKVNGVPETRRARGKVLAVPESPPFFLLVAVDVQDRALTQHMFTITLPWTV